MPLSVPLVSKLALPVLLLSLAPLVSLLAVLTLLSWPLALLQVVLA